MDKNCLFCKIASGEIRADVIYQDETCVAFRDINPQAPTHVLIIPRQHIPTVNDIEPESAELVGKMVLVAKLVAKQEGDCRGWLSIGFQL